MSNLDLEKLVVWNETISEDRGLGIRYRYDDPVDEADAPFLHGHPVSKKTPKGIWLDCWGHFRFVLDGHGKRYAYPTKEEALQSYIIRKQRQIQHSAATHDRAVKLLATAQAMKP